MIGIIGGYGDIGLYAAGILDRSLDEKLRIGGRNADKVSSEIKNGFQAAQWVGADINCEGSMEEFIRGCRIILNCTGQRNGASIKLARIAAKRGCSYIDIAEDEKLESVGSTAHDVKIIHGAGSIPGLSGVLPGYLAGKFDAVEGMEFYYTALGRFSAAAARDYIEGLFLDVSKSMMVWKKGKAVPYEINGGVKKLPLSKKQIRLFPYFDREAELVARELNLMQGQWYMGIDGEHTLKALERARVSYMTDSEKAIDNLCAATQVDCQGRELYAGFVIQMEGYVGREKNIKTLVLKSKNPSELTGSAAAAAVAAVSRGLLRPGVHALGKAVPVKDFMQVMTGLNGNLELEILEGSILKLFEIVTGEI